MGKRARYYINQFGKEVEIKVVDPKLYKVLVKLSRIQKDITSTPLTFEEYNSIIEPYMDNELKKHNDKRRQKKCRTNRRKTNG